MGRPTEDLLATTFSIVITFGTAAIIEHHKQAKEKRQIVLMLMYDLDNSIDQARHCDSVIHTKIPQLMKPWQEALKKNQE